MRKKAEEGAGDVGSNYVEPCFMNLDWTVNIGASQTLVLVFVVQSCPTRCNPCTAAHQALCPWNSPGKNTGVRCHFLLQRIFSDPGIEACSPALQAHSLLTEPPGKPRDDNYIFLTSSSLWKYTRRPSIRIKKKKKAQNDSNRLMSLNGTSNSDCLQSHFMILCYS